MIADFAIKHPFLFTAVLVGLMLVVYWASQRGQTEAAVLPRPGEEE